MRVVHLVVATVICSGCAAKWTKPGITEAEFHRDLLECKQTAAGIYPVQMTQIGSGYQTPATTNCYSYGYSTNCVTTPGTYTPPPQIDINSVARNRATDDCLTSKGYYREQ